MGWRVARGWWTALVLVTVVVAAAAATAAVGSDDPAARDADAAGAPVGTLDREVATADELPVGGSTPAPATATQSVERDSVLLRVDVREDGTARWRVEYRTRLDDPATTAAFHSLQNSIRENPENYSAAFFERIHAAIAAAENATGREMSGGNFSVSTTVRRLPQEYGIVVYSYTWRGFASVSSDELQVGDALSGFFLGEDERLLVSWPDGYELATVEPPADTRREHAVAWSGPTEFDRREPRVVARERPGVVERWLPEAAAATGALVALLLGAWGVRRRRSGPVVAASALRGDDEAASDPELLSNEERVMRLLERRGGRVKQQDVVSELDWTEAKTSQVVSRLREQDRIESFRLGRENVLSLSEPTTDGGERSGSPGPSSDRRSDGGERTTGGSTEDSA
jgi:hypothetical protein